MSMVFKRYPIGGGEMVLALALADHAKDDGTRVFPSIESLITKTRQSRRTVQYQLRRMEEAGWLILVNSGNGGRNQSREYRISPEWISGGDSVPLEIKGAEIAPLEKGANDDTKGAIDDAKGANESAKGCSPLHPHITINESSVTTNESSTPAKLTLPDWLTAESWGMWDRFRKQKGGKAWTDDAKRLSLSTLTKLHAAGNDPKAVIEQSIERGYTGLFDQKNKTNNSTGASRHGNFAKQDYNAGVGADGSF